MARKLHYIVFNLNTFKQFVQKMPTISNIANLWSKDEKTPLTLETNNKCEIYKNLKKFVNIYRWFILYFNFFNSITISSVCQLTL